MPPTEAIADRDADLVRFLDHPPETKGGSRHWLSRSQNVVVEWVEAGAGARPFEVASEAEIMVLLLTTGAAIDGAGQQVRAAARSLCILPPGRFSIAPDGAGACTVFASTRSDLAGRCVLNGATYARPDPRVAPIGAPYRRLKAPDRIEVIALDAVKAPADNPRLKMFQSATLSINWVEYAGPRDRTTLSPHSHADFEQMLARRRGGFRPSLPRELDAERESLARRRARARPLAFGGGDPGAPRAHDRGRRRRAAPADRRLLAAAPRFHR